MDNTTHGFCRHCKRFMRIKKDGTLRHHGGPKGTGYLYAGKTRSYACKGVGEPPKVRLMGHMAGGTKVFGWFVSGELAGRPATVVLEAGDGREYSVLLETVDFWGGGE